MTRRVQHDGWKFLNLDKSDKRLVSLDKRIFFREIIYFSDNII